MGDIADMMLEGDLCYGCGVYLPGESDGFPRHCRDCGMQQVVPSAPKGKTAAQKARAKRKRQKYKANKAARKLNSEEVRSDD